MSHSSPLASTLSTLHIPVLAYNTPALPLTNSTLAEGVARFPVYSHGYLTTQLRAHRVNFLLSAYDSLAPSDVGFPHPYSAIHLSRQNLIRLVQADHARALRHVRLTIFSDYGKDAMRKILGWMDQFCRSLGRRHKLLNLEIAFLSMRRISQQAESTRRAQIKVIVKLAMCGGVQGEDFRQQGHASQELYTEEGGLHDLYQELHPQTGIQAGLQASWKCRRNASKALRGRRSSQLTSFGAAILSIARQNLSGTGQYRSDHVWLINMATNQNTWYHRRVAETSAKACWICYKPSASVLVKPDNSDFFYICPGHLTDRGFCTPDPAEAAAAEERKKKAAMDREIEAVKKEFEEKKKKREEKRKDKKKEGKKDEKKDEEKQEDQTDEKEMEDKIKAIEGKEQKPAADDGPRIFQLKKNFYQMRIDRRKNAEMAKRNRDRLANPGSFPSVPTGQP